MNMKEAFPGYNKKTEEEIKEIWNTGTICFDSNVLLNLYQYSENTRNSLLNLIEKLKEKIWLPHQTALEYNRRRYDKIVDQLKIYKNFTDSIKNIEKDLQSNKQPPFLSETVNLSLKEVFEKVKREVDESIKKFETFFKCDSIYKSIEQIFKDKIEEPYSNEELDEIFKEGERRYEKEIPPGFEDRTKPIENRKYGDLIIWKQIIKYSKKTNKPVILITDDGKKDWWWKISNGMTIGPNQKLIEEILKEAKVDFHMYSSDRFLLYGLEYVNDTINNDAIDEIKEMKELAEDTIKISERFNYFSNESKILILKRKWEVDNLESQIHEINDEINIMIDRLHDAERRRTGVKNRHEKINFYSLKIDELSKRRETLIEQRRNLMFEFENENLDLPHSLSNIDTYKDKITITESKNNSLDPEQNKF